MFLAQVSVSLKASVPKSLLSLSLWAKVSAEHEPLCLSLYWPEPLCLGIYWVRASVPSTSPYGMSASVPSTSFYWALASVPSIKVAVVIVFNFWMLTLYRFGIFWIIPAFRLWFLQHTKLLWLWNVCQNHHAYIPIQILHYLFHNRRLALFVYGINNSMSHRKCIVIHGYL